MSEDCSASSELGNYRWSLSEYVLRVELGEDIREVLVEGVVDRDLFARAMRRWNLGGAVRESDFIVVTPEETAALGLNHGVKAQLWTIAASLSASRHSPALVNRVAVVVDRDYDDELAAAAQFALYTDGFSIENYALDVAALDRFVEEVLGRSARPLGAGGRSTDRYSCSGLELYERIAEALVELASVRMTLRTASPPLTPFSAWLDYAVVDGNGRVSLDGDRLLVNVLTTMGRREECSTFRARRAESRALAANDPKRWVRGRDFVDLLSKVLRSKWGRRRNGNVATAGSATDMSRRLLFAVDPIQLDASVLFRSLRERFA